MLTFLPKMVTSAKLRGSCCIHSLKSMPNIEFLPDNHCVKNVCIWVFLVRIFSYLDWIRKGTECFSVFSSNTGKYGPEKLQIRTLFTQCKFQKRINFGHYCRFSFLLLSGRKRVTSTLGKLVHLFGYELETNWTRVRNSISLNIKNITKRVLKTKLLLIKNC